MIYLASAYSSDDPAVREARYQAACRATAVLLMGGETVFSPIVHSHVLLEHGCPNTWEFWKEIDYGFLTRCSALYVLMLPGWEESVGVKQEIKWAEELELPIKFLDPVMLEPAQCAK